MTLDNGEKRKHVKENQYIGIFLSVFQSLCTLYAGRLDTKAIIKEARELTENLMPEERTTPTPSLGTSLAAGDTPTTPSI